MVSLHTNGTVTKAGSVIFSLLSPTSVNASVIDQKPENLTPNLAQSPAAAAHSTTCSPVWKDKSVHLCFWHGMLRTPRLASHLLCRRHQTPDLSVSTQVLRLQAYATMPSLCCAGNWTQGFLCARQSLNWSIVYPQLKDHAFGRKQVKDKSLCCW